MLLRSVLRRCLVSVSVLDKVLRIRVVKMVVLRNGGFPPCRKQVVLTKTAKITSLHSTHKSKGFRSQSPENDENDENDENHSGKTRVY